MLRPPRRQFAELPDYVNYLNLQLIRCVYLSLQLFEKMLTEGDGSPQTIEHLADLLVVRALRSYQLNKINTKVSTR